MRQQVSEPIPAFAGGSLEDVCKVLGELYIGTELTRISQEVPLRDDPGEGSTKRHRLAYAVSGHQAKTGNGNALVRLVTVAMRPPTPSTAKLTPMQPATS